MVQEFEHMWDGRLGQIGIAKQRISLTSTDIQLATSLPYHAESRAQEVEKTENDKKLRVNVIEPKNLDGHPLSCWP